MSFSVDRPRAYSATISALEVWCSRDCLGRLLIGFFSELDALAAAEFYNVRIAVSQLSDESTGIWIFQGIYTIADPSRSPLNSSRYVAVDPDTEEVVSGFEESYDDLVASLGVKHGSSSGI